jgi:hypothetical protein
VEVDSFRFLPRSFRPFYENASPAPGEDTSPVCAPLTRRLAQTQVTLLTSAGLYLRSSQAPFDVEGERARARTDLPPGPHY